MTSPVDLLVDALERAGKQPRRSGDRVTAKCPAHDDRSPSLSIRAGDDGRALVKCHANCTVEAVVAALGLEMRDLFVQDRPGAATRRTTSIAPKQPGGGKKRHATAEAALQAAGRAKRWGGPVQVWRYEDANGKPLVCVGRFHPPGGKKQFIPARCDGGHWIAEPPSSNRPLYNLAAIGRAEEIWIVEGEKCADALNAIGLCATTALNGCKAPVEKTDWRPLSGQRRIVLVPDLDAGGAALMQNIAVCVSELEQPPEIRIIAKLPGLENKGDDVVEFIEANGAEQAKAALLRLRDEAPVWAPEPPLIGLARAGVRPITMSTIEGPPRIDYLCEPILAYGFMTILLAHPKVGKTTLIGQLLRDATYGGEFIQKPIEGRILVVTEEPVQLLHRRHQGLGLRDNVVYLTRKEVARLSWAELNELVAEEVEANDCRIVIYDTIGQFWSVESENDGAEMTRALNAARRVAHAGAAMLIVHHLKKNSSEDVVTSGRGSGAIAGEVDILVGMRRIAGDPGDSRRSLKVVSRVDGDSEIVVRLDEQGRYRIIAGGRRKANDEERKQLIQNLLQPGEWLGWEQVRDRWREQQPTVSGYAKANICKLLNEGADEGLWRRRGEGVKNDEFLYSTVEEGQA